MHSITNLAIVYGSQYHVVQGQWEPMNSSETNLSRLSLFSHLSSDNQITEFAAMCQSFATTLWVRLVQTESHCYWDIRADYQSLQSFIQQCVAGSCFDYLLWPELQILPPQLIVFDMDSTFVEIEVIDELAKRHNVGEQVSQVTEAAMRGELDFAESLVNRVSCLNGLPAKVIDEIAASLPISKGVEFLVEQAKKNNCQVAIVSGGFKPFVEHLKSSLGLFKVKANELKIEDGVITGELVGEIVDAKAKAEFLIDLCNQLKINTEQVLAVGDGANDLEMMAAAGFNLAYRAKPKVQAKANGRINFTHLGYLADVFGWE
ncbi:phosphoserine phosphatase SerB [Aliikangiella sp. IMCC44359]|uniref:phosphoserine phosphatase SerB n=1 Tax=Aliikangiella sp. IMCC44359 TaxID=3459125 RepID=UPI00403AF2F2